MTLRIALAVFCVATVTAPLETDTPETYCVAVVEQPEFDRSMPAKPPFACVDRYSATEVLQAAAAASPSDIFERMT